jgi:hypothetical protein
MHAVGFTSKKPHSIPAHTVFSRCAVVAANFTTRDADACMGLVERRNEELHSGTPAFAQFPTRLWLSEYYRGCELLLQAQGKALDDLFGTAEAKAAVEMIRAAEEKTVKTAQAAIAVAGRDFNNLDEALRDQRSTHGEAITANAAEEMDKIIECPACGSKARLWGQAISTSDPRLEDDQVVQETVLLPTELECYSCALKLVGHVPWPSRGSGANTPCTGTAILSCSTATSKKAQNMTTNE